MIISDRYQDRERYKTQATGSQIDDLLSEQRSLERAHIQRPASRRLEPKFESTTLIYLTLYFSTLSAISCKALRMD